jgi:hypothetical protein
LREFLISSSGFSLQRTMSTFSPLSSSTTFRMRLPRTPDAGAQAVHAVVRRMDRDLRAVSRLRGDALDDDGAVADLGHLELEEPADEVLVAARDHDADRGARALDLGDVGAEAVADAVVLARAPGRP